MRALLIEDDTILSHTIKQCIQNKFEVDCAFDGEEGIIYAKQDIYDVIILDLMIPIINGYEVLKELRAEDIYTPVLILTAKDTLEDKIKGFNLGADDYVVKPFEKEELIARLEAIIRRNNKSYRKNEIQFEKLVLNLDTRKAYVSNQELKIQGKQFDMLEYLVNSTGKIITKEQIFDKIWGFNCETTANVVEVYASGLRKELKKYNYDKYFKTIRGVGYILIK